MRRRATTRATVVAVVLLCGQTVLGPWLAAQENAPGAAPSGGPGGGSATSWGAAVQREAVWLAARGARAEGSAGESEVIDYLVRELTSLGLAPRRRSFAEAEFAHSFPWIVDATIAGVRPDLLVVAVPLEAAAAAAPDALAQAPADAPAGGLGLALALAFARSTAHAAGPPPVSVRFLFLGAERGDSALGYPLGSRLFVQEFHPSAPAAVLYLDLDRVPGRLLLKAGSSSGAAPSWLIANSAAALRAGGQRLRVTSHITQLVSLGLVREPLLDPFVQAGYPAVRLAGQGRPRNQADRDRWLERMYDFFPQLLARFDGGIPDSWERHYLLFQGLGSFLIVPEAANLIGLVIALSLAVTFAFVVPSRFVHYLGLVLSDGWRIPLIALLTFGALSGATAGLRLLLELRDIPTLWQGAPVWFLALKLAIAMLLVFAVLRLPWWRRFPILRFAPVGSSYSAAAIFVLVAQVIASAGLNITLTFYFTWAFICALVASLARNRWAKLVWIVLAPLWIVRAVGGLFLLPVLPFVETVLLSTTPGDLITTVVLLPFVLLGLRATHSFVDHRHTARAEYRYPLWLIGAILGLALVVVGASSAILSINPYGRGRDQPLAARTLIDLDTGRGALELSSPAPIGWVEVTFAGKGRTLTTRERRLSLPLEPIPSLMMVAEHPPDEPGKHRLSFAPQGAPSAIRLTLDSTDAFDLLDANYPFRRRGAASYEILVGASPPNPLAIHLSLPRDLELSLHYVVDYDRPPLALTIESPRKELTTSLRLVGSIAIST